MRYKNDRIKKEWESEKVDKRLQIILLYLDWYCKNFAVRTDGKKTDIQVTGLHRTQKEQDRIYRNNPKYKKKPWKSVHQDWRGGDVGVNAFSTKTKRFLRDMLNRRFKNMGTSKVCVWHDIGLGDHFHLQVGSGAFSKVLK